VRQGADETESCLRARRLGEANLSFLAASRGEGLESFVRSGRVEMEADLESPLKERLQVGPGQMGVSPSFEQTERQVFCRAKTSRNDLPEQAAPLEELSEHVGNLQQEVEKILADVELLV